MKSRNHPSSSAHYTPTGPEIGKTISYLLRSNQEPIRALRALVQSKLEDILDVIAEDDKIKRIIFTYGVHSKLSRRQSEYMRQFLWGKFAGSLMDSSAEEAADEDAGEFGNAKLKVLGEKIRHSYADKWWSGDMADVAETAVNLIQEILLHYGGDYMGENLDNFGENKNTAVKTKKEDKHLFEKIPYGGDASLAMEREDTLSIDTILTMMSSYFDTMDMKVNVKMTHLTPLSKERESGRWESIQKIMQKIKKLTAQTAIVDALEENSNALSAEGVKTVIQRFDSYAILHEEGEL